MTRGARRRRLTGGALLIHSDHGRRSGVIFSSRSIYGLYSSIVGLFFSLAVFWGPCFSCFILPIMYQSIPLTYSFINSTSLQVAACGDITPCRCVSCVQSSDNCPLTSLHHGSDCGARLVYLGTVCHVTRIQSGVPGCRYSLLPESLRRSHLDIPIHLQGLTPASPSGIF